MGRDVGKDARGGRVHVHLTGRVSQGGDGAGRIVDLHGGRLLIPEGQRLERSRPLVVALHGAGARPEQMLDLLGQVATTTDLLVFALRSAATTWDLLLGGFGPDVLALQTGLDEVVQRGGVDLSRVAIAGFSDGASYALSLGLANGDVFSTILAWSPGFVAPTARTGQPRVFVSHGTRDQVLPIDRCSCRIVPQLRREGYAVEYLEFDGPHAVPAEVVSASVEWWLHSA